MSGILHRLVANSRKAVDEGIYDTDYTLRPCSLPFDDALAEMAGRGIIPEIKFASPSRGRIRSGDPAYIAAQMVKGGAVAISVLTQPYSFGGSPNYLAAVREATNIPLLMKDIIIDVTQLEAAVAIGANCILLIQAVFDAGYADRDMLIREAHRKGIQVLLEVHDKAELASALESKCDVVGVNNRNLDTLEVSLQITCGVLEGYSDGRLVVAESGIYTVRDIMRLRDCGASAFLVGSSIMEGDDITGAVRRLASS